MKKMMIQYKVTPELAAENQRYIEGVFEALHATAPQGVRYVTFKGEDGVSFTHIVSLETENDENPIPQLPAFQAFQAEIGERCADGPVSMVIEEVGSYRV